MLNLTLNLKPLDQIGCLHRHGFCTDPKSQSPPAPNALTLSKTKKYHIFPAAAQTAAKLGQLAFVCYTMHSGTWCRNCNRGSRSLPHVILHGQQAFDSTGYRHSMQCSVSLWHLCSLMCLQHWPLRTVYTVDNIDNRI
jgi:hypothetical protein